MQKNKIIAIWGNPNSGKTTHAIKLATELSKKKKNVILVLCDHITPSVSSALPLVDTKDHSLGELLSSAQITQESILGKCISVEKNDYLSVIGYLHGENERTYAKYSKERVVDLFILLKHLADYIVIDCSSLVSYDILTRTALELSDQVIRLISPDLKAISFYDACLPMIAERKYNLQNHIKVLSNVKSNMPKDHVANKYGGITLELPFSAEIETQYFEGALFDRLTSKDSQGYLNTVEEVLTLIAEEVQSTPKAKGKTNLNMLFKRFKSKGGEISE